MFKPRNSAQMAAALLAKAGDQNLNVVKLTKLLYLVEREFMGRHGFSISGDRMVSMPKGPVLSETLNLTNGAVDSVDWEEWVEDREGHNVRLKKNFSREDLDSLSDAAIDSVDAVWEQFGHMTQWELVKYTHDHCAEWEDPGSSAFPIPAKRVFLAVGKSGDEADHLAREIQAQNAFEALFAG